MASGEGFAVFEVDGPDQIDELEQVFMLFLGQFRPFGDQVCDQIQGDVQPFLRQTVWSGKSYLKPFGQFFQRPLGRAFQGPDRFCG